MLLLFLENLLHQRSSLLALIILVLQFDSLYIKPDRKEKSRSISKEYIIVFFKHGVADPSEAISRHEGPGSGIQVAEEADFFGLFDRKKGGRKHDISHNTAQERTNGL